MDSAQSQKTLIEIASVSQDVVNTLVRSSGRKTVESFQLDKIVVSSGAVLATLNKALLLKDRIFDDRLRDWLSSEEPQICLGVLNQMQALLRAKLDHGVQNFFQVSRPTSIKDKSNEAIGLFQKRKDCFQFLLTTGIWNCESGVQQQSRTVLQSALPIDEAVNNHSPMRVTQYKSGDASGVSHGRKTRGQRINMKKLSIILEWFDALKCGETHERTILLRQPDTCTWLPNTDAYKAWKTTENSFLWLHGKAGAGKSVLAASVIEALKNALQDEEVLALFYCDFRNERSTSSTEVMRSILSQLIQQFCHHTVDAGDLIEELVKEKDGATSVISNGVLLARYVSRAAKLFSRQPFIVIDALDECKDIERLLDSLVELSKGGVRLFVTSRSLLVIKNCFSNLPSISMDAMKYAVSADIILHVTRELDSHQRLRILEVGLKNEIYTKLYKKADGMFRWVECQLNVLKRCVTTVRIREALNDLPTDLNATYERILLNASKDEHEGQVVRRALDWLVAALKPLQLSQVVEGLSIDLVRRALDRDSGPVHGTILLDVLGSLVTYDEATDIVILSHFSVKEYLIGQPIRTIQAMYHINQHDAHERLALLCICYVGVCLQQSGGHEGSYPDVHSIDRYAQDTAGFHPTRRHKSPPEHHPLLEYVMSLGLFHLAHVDPRKKSVLKAIKTLQSDAQQHPSEWERFRERTYYSYPPWPTLEHDIMLYILVAFAPEPLLRSFIGHVRLKPKDGTNPLIYAAHFYKIEHARTLLSSGVCVNRRGWHVNGRYQVLPIQVVAPADGTWDFDMLDLFLTEGSSVPHESFVHVFQKYCYAPTSIVSRLLQTDEFVEWAADARHQGLLLHALDFTRYPNGCPSEQEVDVIERRLLQIGCDLPARFNETSLRRAVSAGHVSTVRDILSQQISLPPDIILDASCSENSHTEMICLLLSKGCNVNVASPTGDTPLHLVMICFLPEDDCLESVQVLIDAGCNPSACNLVGETPLHLAVAYGYISLVEHLLSLHVPLPLDILLTKPKRLKLAMVHLLMGKGVDVHAIAADGNTPLHLILDNHWLESDECQDCVKILVDAGCNPFLSNALGETPFDIAAKNGRLSVMEYLLSLRLNLPLSPHTLLFVAGCDLSEAIPVAKLLIDNGADIHASRSNGDSLLHLSMACGSETESLRRIKLLIGAGCDPCVSNLAGETPFHEAAKRRYISVMEYLLPLGISVPSDIMLTQFQWLYSASLSRMRSTIYFLCKKGGDIHTVTGNGNNLLHSVAMVHEEHDALDLTKFLVRAGCNPRALNSNHESPLHAAARNGHVSVVDYLLSLDVPLPPDILLAATSTLSEGFRLKTQSIRYLIDKGASVSVVTTDGDTPLHLVLAGMSDEYHQLECVTILVDAGCDPCSRNRAGKTPLHNAASCGLITILKHFLSQSVPLPPDILLTSTPNTIRFLLGKGMDGVSVDNELMHRALDSEFFEDDCLECARILIGAGYEPSLRNASGETPMHVAARCGQIYVVKYLLSQNVPLPIDILLAPMQVKYYWDTPVRISLLRILIGEGARVNTTAPSGDTPLHFAIRNKSVPWEYIKILLECGSDPYARNVDGEMPIDLAGAKGPFFKENFLRLIRNSCTQRPRS